MRAVPVLTSASPAPRSAARGGRTRTRLLALALCATLVSIGCGDEETKGDPSGADAGPDDGEEEVPCRAEYPVYHEGITVKAGELTVSLLTVSPEPPRQQTPNTWMLEVKDAAGAPAAGFTIENPDSYMPVHGHKGKRPPKVVPQSEPGRVQLAAIDFTMRGPWQVNFDVVPQGGAAIPATLQICVQ